MKKKNKTFFMLAILMILSLIISGCGVVTQPPESEQNLQIVETEIPLTESNIVKSEPPITIHYLDVGQGDSTLIVIGDKTMLIDAAESKQAPKIIKYIEDQGIKKIDYLVGTHPHADHIGGMAQIIKKFNIGEIYMPRVAHTTKTFEELIDTIAEKDYSVSSPKPGDILKIGEAEVVFLAPEKYDENNLNNCSLVFRIEVNEFGFIFMGDAETPIETEIINSKREINSNVIKIGHHGANNATSENFIKTVNPDIAIIYVGKDNSYGHPTSAVLDRLIKYNADIYRTDIHGDIVVTLTDGELTVKTNKENNLSTAPAPTAQEQKPTEAPAKTSSEQYIGNLNSKKFHVPTCRTLPDEKNRIYFDTRKEAIDKGYNPCGNCKP